MLIHDVGNIDCTDQRNLLLAFMPGYFPKEQKGCRRGTGDQLYIDQHNLKETKTWRKDVVMAWIDYKKSLLYDLQIWIIGSRNERNIGSTHESNGKLESGISSKRTNPTRGENPKRHLPGRLTLTTVIRCSNDATHLYNDEGHEGSY